MDSSIERRALLQQASTFGYTRPYLITRTRGELCFRQVERVILDEASCGSVGRQTTKKEIVRWVSCDPSHAHPLPKNVKKKNV